jgi:peptidoglycan/LPS O-acetylase OafA/YrhL
MPQLDALRTIAVLLVIVSHWFSHQHFLNRYTSNGILGVTLFFVLSGFLITGILLKNKNSIDQGGSVKSAYKTFYIRRSLRIFPIYYLLLVILIILNIPVVYEGFNWHLLYLSNFYFWIKGEFAGNLSHFWSLAVEEQFYLFWPTVIFFVPRKKLVATFFLCIIGSTLFRIFLFSPPNHMGRFLMPASLDSFCIGALLAYGQQYSKHWYQWLLNKAAVLITAVAGLYIAYSVLHPKLDFPSNDYFFLSFYFLLISVLFGLVIMKCSVGIRNKFLAPVLNNKVLIFLGKISYGLYLYHNFIPYFYNIKVPEVLSPVSIYIAQFARLLVLVGVSSLSWYLIERPLLKLKERFSYKPRVVTASKSRSRIIAVAPNQEVHAGE